MSAPPPPPFVERRARRFGVPDARTLLGWLFTFRLVLSALILVRAGIIWDSAPDLAFMGSIGVLFIFVLTAWGAYQALVRRQAAGIVFLLIQAVADLGAVTGLVHLGGDAATALAALYVVVIAVYALLLPIGVGLAVAVGAALAYVASALGTGRVGEIEAGLWGQLVVFGFVFVLVALLGHGLQDTVAQRSQLETQLRRVQFEASEVLRSIKTGVVTVDSDGLLAFANPAALRLLGLGGQDVVGRPVLDRLAQMAPELFDAVVRGIRRGERVGRGEGIVRRDDGRTFPIGLSTTTFEQDGGGQGAVTALFTDLSELKQLQELHLRAERLEAVAALSASLAHEIRNPLASIRSSVEQLAFKDGADEDDEILGRLIVKESDRLNRLLGEFLDFSRVRATNFSPVDLLALAEETGRLVREHPDCGAGVTLEVTGQATPLEADEDLLRRVVLNLVLNAAQSCRGEGRVEVRVHASDTADLPPGAGIDDPVTLVVTDNGPGIDPEVLPRLFEPFVSRRSGGSGLGLAIVQRAVAAHRGIVLVDSPPERGGARFTIHLPRRPYREDTA